MTTGEAARLLGCSVQHVRLLIRTDKVIGAKRGRDWFVRRPSADAYLSARYAPRAAKAPLVAKTQGRLFDESEFHPIVNVASVPQRSPFRYPGGKTWLIPEVRTWLGGLPSRPRLLVEPFAGGGGVGLAAAFEGLADASLLVELDPDVASVWRTILGEEAGLLAALIRSFECTEEEVRRALARPASDDLARAFLTVLRNRVSRGGILAPGAGLVKTGEANKGIASRWYPETLARRIEAIAERRDRIRCREADGLEVFREHADRSDVAYFVDPPYPVAGKRLYRFHRLDHRRLFETLASLAGPFLATYDDNPEIEALAEEFGFERKLIPMKSTHHAKKYELMIGRDLGWLASGATPPRSDAVSPRSDSRTRGASPDGPRSDPRPRVPAS